MNRGGETIFPRRAETQLHMGNVVTVMADAASEQALRSFLEGTELLAGGETG